MTRERLTWDKFEQEVARDAQLTIIHGRLYDLSRDFMRWHPGGAVAATQIGRDGSAAFDAFHDPSTQEELANFYVGDMDNEATAYLARDILKVHQLITENGWWHASRPYYIWKFVSTLSLALIPLWVLRQHAQHNFLLLLLAACLMALFFQQSGWLSHDCLHNQVCKQRKYNYFLAFVTASIWQGFAPSWWMNKHNTHHAVPNIHGEDPDLNTMPFLAWSEDALELFSDYSDDTLAKFWISHQPLLFFPLFVLVRLSWIASSILYPLYGNVRVSMATIETSGIALHCIWQFGLPFLWLSPSRAFAYFILSQGLGSILLASVFVLNHNGRAVFNKDTMKAKDFYELQIFTSRNVQSTPFLDWVTGGLNYQIEHHLFPTLPRHNFHLVAPLVQEICARHHVHYHKTTFGQGMIEVLERLRRVGDLAGKRP